jgi:ribose 5-phosphate isomerase A
MLLTTTRVKMKAAERAIELVESGMTVGLGSGSTASMWIRLLGERVRDRGLQVTAVASSGDTERLGRSYDIPFVTIDKCNRIDLTVDGADEIAPGLALIKGSGGSLVRETIVASSKPCKINRSRSVPIFNPKPDHAFH